MFLACSGESGAERSVDTLPSSPAAADEGTAPGSDTGAALRVADSWVDGATNGVGVQGAFFTYQDGSGRTVITADATRTQTGYCVSGSAAEVLGGDFGGTYGAVAALNLYQSPGTTATGQYDATAHGVIGFGFEIVGDAGGALRFVVKQYQTHDGFCIDNVPNCASGCSVEYRIDELTQNCWTPGGPAPDASRLQALEWQITTKEGAPTEFDYCIENIYALVDPAFTPPSPPLAGPSPAAEPVEGPEPPGIGY